MPVPDRRPPSGLRGPAGELLGRRRECDLLERLLDAYQEVHPLSDGWEDRIALHQLFPLLVHACMFGGGYAGRAAELAARDIVLLQWGRR